MQELDINDIFQPSAAIRTNHRDLFVGRERQVAQAIGALASDGASLCVLGERGVGKTSLTWRIKEYLSGDRTWLTARGGVPFKIPDFDVIWLEVQTSHRNIIGVIADLLADRGRSERFYEFSVANELSTYLSRGSEARVNKLLDGAILRTFADEIKTPIENPDAESALKKLSDKDAGILVKVFREGIEHISAQRDRTLLIVLDEIDRLPDKTGLGDFIKTGNQIRFCVVGVADTLEEIVVSTVVSDHPSAERKIFSLLVDRLSSDEVAEFLANSNRKLFPQNIKFSDDFLKLLTDYSEGFPYMLHRLSRDALLRAIQDVSIKPSSRNPDSLKIDAKYFYHALDGFINPRVDGGNRYRKLALVDNSGKESALYALASFSSGWVSMDTLERRLESSYGFNSNIIDLESDGLIRKVSDPEGNINIRFFDPVLRAIVKRLNEREKRLYKKKSKRVD